MWTGVAGDRFRVADDSAEEPSDSCHLQHRNTPSSVINHRRRVFGIHRTARVGFGGTGLMAAGSDRTAVAGPAASAASLRGQLETTTWRLPTSWW